MVFTANSIDEYTAQQDLSKVIQVRDKTKVVLEDIKAFLKPGIKESLANTRAEEIYKGHGVTRSWHRPYIRFGANTLLTYMDQAKQDLTLQESDIAFMDIGPIFDDMEGDLGETIVFGDNKVFLDLKKTSEQLFADGKAFYTQQNPSGKEMYEFLCAQAENYGYEFNLHTCGHLIGLFSHSGCGESGGMRSYTGKMQNGLWILEIQIKHKSLSCGAFYEDLLL